MTEPGRNIIGRFAVVYISIVIVMLLLIVNIIKIQFIEGENWLAITDNYERANIPVQPNRGNIYSANGELMASSIPEYYVYMDMRIEAFEKDSGKFFYEMLDSVSEGLSQFFGDKSKAAYKRDLTQAFKSKRAEYPFYKQRISYFQLQELRTLPLFRQGKFKSGLLTKEMFTRVKPYTSLASRTIGDIYADESKGGKNGLEAGLDSILKGEPGLATRRKVANTLRDIVQVEPIDGMDVVSTINIDFQDIAEKALLEKLREIDAQTGYAIVMEVNTGELKAIVNMEKNRNGSYSENRNGAVADKVEPGSTFKIASLMAVLDDGKAELSDVIETGNGLYNYGRAVMRDHNAHRGGYGSITLEQGLNASSNVAISRTIYNAYANNPGKFVEKLHKMGLNESFDLYIPGSASPWIRHPKDNPDRWYATTLPWMSIGYEVQLAPIYTLAFYNAIANNGKFIEPLLVKSINRNGQIVKEFQARTIREQICKPSTLEDVRRVLLGVVEDPKYGTGKAAHSPHVRIAGKTGTAQISKGSSGYGAGGKTHQVSFCGFFPYENPRYTCIVVIREPRIGLPSGGLMAGTVVKNIAERINAIDKLATVYELKQDSLYLAKNGPEIKNGNFSSLANVMRGLKIDHDGEAAEWVGVKTENEETTLSPLKLESGKMPNLLGMGAKDAVYVCEKTGLRPVIEGIGKTVSQSIQPGETIREGERITLTLSL